MRLLPRRWPLRILAAYLFLLAISLALVIAKPGAAPAPETALPAWAPGEAPGGEEAGGWAGRLGGRFFEAVLRLGLPLVDVYQPGQLWPFERRDIWAWFLRLATGFRPGQPLMWLEAELPALALAREGVDAAPTAAVADFPVIPSAAAEGRHRARWRRWGPRS